MSNETLLMFLERMYSHYTTNLGILQEIYKIGHMLLTVAIDATNKRYRIHTHGSKLKHNTSVGDKPQSFEEFESIVMKFIT